MLPSSTVVPLARWVLTVFSATSYSSTQRCAPALVPMNERRASPVGASALSSQKACSASPNSRSNSRSPDGSPSSERTSSLAPVGVGRRVGARRGRRGGVRRESASLLASPSVRERVEVLEQLAAVLGGDRLGVKLHAPQRAAACVRCPSPHRRPSTRSRARQDPDRRRRRASGSERPRSPGGCPQTGRCRRARTALRRPCMTIRCASDDPVEQAPEALVAEAHPEHGDLAAAQDVRAHAEVVPALGAARARAR